MSTDTRCEFMKKEHKRGTVALCETSDTLWLAALLVASVNTVCVYQPGFLIKVQM